MKKGLAVICGLFSAMAVGLISLWHSPVARSAPQVNHTFVVDSAYDANNSQAFDSNPGDSLCIQVYDGKCGLRAAIMEANALTGTTTIKFNVPVSTIQLAAALPQITSNMIVDGPGPAALTINANVLARHFFISPGVNFTVKNLTLAAGIAGQTSNYGGSIYSDGGNVTVENVTFNGNQAGSNYAGGAIATQSGGLWVSRSSFNNNTAGSGGAIYGSGGYVGVAQSTFYMNSSSLNPGLGSAIFSYNGAMLISNSTFAGNSAADSIGGAVADTLLQSTQYTRIINATFYNNTNGAIRSNTAIVTNTILAAGPSGSNTCLGLVQNGGHNIDSGSSCYWVPAYGSVNNTDPQLDLSGYTGVGVIPLLPGSPAINAGINAACAQIGNIDQRGFRRVTPCDIGAYEVSRPTFLPLALKNK